MAQKITFSVGTFFKNLTRYDLPTTVQSNLGPGAYTQTVSDKYVSFSPEVSTNLDPATGYPTEDEPGYYWATYYIGDSRQGTDVWPYIGLAGQYLLLPVGESAYIQFWIFHFKTKEDRKEWFDSVTDPPHYSANKKIPLPSMPSKATFVGSWKLTITNSGPGIASDYYVKYYADNNRIPLQLMRDVTATPGEYPGRYLKMGVYIQSWVGTIAPYYGIVRSNNYGDFPDIYFRTYGGQGEEWNAASDVVATATFAFISFNTETDLKQWTNGQRWNTGDSSIVTGTGTLVGTWTFPCDKNQYEPLSTAGYNTKMRSFRPGDSPSPSSNPLSLTFDIPNSFDSLRANIASDITKITALAGKTNNIVNNLLGITNITTEKFLTETGTFLSNTISNLAKLKPNIELIYDTINKGFQDKNILDIDHDLYANLISNVESISTIVGNTQVDLDRYYESISTKTNTAIALMGTISPAIVSASDEAIQKSIKDLGDLANTYPTMTEINVYVNSGKFLSEKDDKSKYSKSASSILTQLRTEAVKIFSATDFKSNLDAIAANISAFNRTN